MKTSFLSTNALKKIGFKSVGENVLVSKKASFYNPEGITIGSNVRIDDFCILSGNISIGNNVHISAGCYLYGGDSLISIGNHVAISSRCALYAISDDFSGAYLVGSSEASNKRNVYKKDIIIYDFSVIGTGSTLLPGSILNEGSVVAAMSFVKDSLDSWYIYGGIPCRKLKERKKDLLGLIDEN